MTITVIVRSVGSEGARLTFDGTQRVVIGRGPGSDVRLPDPSVSHRHATLRAQGAEFVLVDEGSTNGTFVGAVRIAPNTSRLVRSGDAVRVGRIWLELRLDLGPVTRDLAAATRDLALAIVADAVAAAGTDATVRVRVVEGADLGSAIALAQVGREYLVGRGPHCDLRLTDPDVSREHFRVARVGGDVVFADAGTKNGTSLGGVRIGPGDPIVWRAARMVKIGRTVLSLEEPLREALARIESSPDERLAPGEASGAFVPGAGEIGSFTVPSCAAPGIAAPAPPAPGDSVPSCAAPAPAPGASPDLESRSEGVKSAPPDRSTARGRRAHPWSAADIAVMAAAVGVLTVSLVGLFWLLRG